MKQILFLVLITISLPGKTQYLKNDTTSNPCESASTQADLNDCEAWRYKNLDVIIYNKYFCILDYLETEIRNAELEPDTFYIKYYKNLEQAIINSQEKWEKLKEANSDFYSFFHNGGSITPMKIYRSAITDADDRIKRLDDFIELLGIDCKTNSR